MDFIRALTAARPPHWYSSSEWWIVIIAALTGIAVAWQARETAKATRAVERNTRAFIDSQKPTIIAEAKGQPLNDLMESVPRVRLVLSNKGPTTAYHCLYESWIELVPRVEDRVRIVEPFVFTEAADHFRSDNPFSLYPNHSGIVINIPIRAGLTDEQKTAIKKAQLLVCVRIRVNFRDRFTSSRYAEHGFWIMLEGLQHLSKYNDSN